MSKYDAEPEDKPEGNLPIPGPYTAMVYPELLQSCEDGTNRHEMEDYRIWWCLGLAQGRRCKKCSYKNAFAYD